MTEPRFHDRPEPIDLERLVALTGASLVGTARPREIAGVGPLDWAGPGELAVATGQGDVAALEHSDAGACLMPPELAVHAPAGMAVLVSADPARAFAAAAAVLFPASGLARPLFGKGISLEASTHPDARFETDVSVDAGAVVGPQVEIGRGALVGANAVVGAGVRIGRDSVLGPGCVVEHALIGDRVRLQPGVRIGSGGPGRLGRAIVQDGVEIGANAIVERGASRDTIVGEGSEVGALVRIGPDAVLGRNCIICPGTTVADGAVFDDGAVIGLDTGS